MPRVRKAPAAPAASPRIWPKVSWPWVAVVLLVAAIIGASAFAVLRHGSATGVGTIAFAQIEHTASPPHVGDQFLQEVQTAGGFGSTLDLGDDQKMDRLREAFAKHPWVCAVERMDRSLPNRLQVELRFRVPAALATVERVGMFIDNEGVRVPTPHGPPEIVAGLLRLEGDVAPPRGEPGQPWGIPAVETAARLAGLLAAERERFRFVAIEIDISTLESELRLRTAGGTRVIWQTLPADPGERIAEKLARLAAYCDQHEGSLDRPAGPYLLDVRPPGGITRQSLKERR